MCVCCERNACSIKIRKKLLCKNVKNPLILWSNLLKLVIILSWYIIHLEPIDGRGHISIGVSISAWEHSDKNYFIPVWEYSNMKITFLSRSTTWNLLNYIMGPAIHFLTTPCFIRFRILVNGCQDSRWQYWCTCIKWHQISSNLV